MYELEWNDESEKKNIYKCIIDTYMVLYATHINIIVCYSQLYDNNINSWFMHFNFNAIYRCNNRASCVDFQANFEIEKLYCWCYLLLLFDEILTVHFVHLFWMLNLNVNVEPKIPICIYKRFWRAKNHKNADKVFSTICVCCWCTFNYESCAYAYV